MWNGKMNYDWCEKHKKPKCKDCGIIKMCEKCSKEHDELDRKLKNQGL